MSVSGGWQDDLLGPDFHALTLDLGSDGEGPLAATLIRYNGDVDPTGPAAGCDVLQVHGWSDYFFQEHEARWWAEAGARFFALDLRKYGRSLREGQTPGQVNDLADYDAEIELALAAMSHGPPPPEGAGIRGRGFAKGRKRRPLILVGHSAGGLALALWAHRHPGRAAALILNSPWLEFQGNRFVRRALDAGLNLSDRVTHQRILTVPEINNYFRSISRELDGEWAVDERLRPPFGFDIPLSWIGAIFAGHHQVAAGLDLSIPVLVLISRRSTLRARWGEDMKSSDIVLSVDYVARRSPSLGSLVTIARIDGAIHEVFLSRKPVREAAWRTVRRWLEGFAPGRAG